LRVGGAQLLQRRFDVPGEVVERGPVARVLLRRDFGAELARPAALCVVLVELVAEQPAHRLRVLVQGDVRLEHLEDARLVADRQAARAFGPAAERLQLAHAPLGLDVARREHRDQHAGLRDALDQRFAEHVVALQLAVAPDSNVLAEQLRQQYFQALVQRLDPPVQPFGERLVVEVRVADKDVFVEWHLGVRAFGAGWSQESRGGPARAAKLSCCIQRVEKGCQHDCGFRIAVCGVNDSRAVKSAILNPQPAVIWA